MRKVSSIRTTCYFTSVILHLLLLLVAGLYLDFSSVPVVVGTLRDVLRDGAKNAPPQDERIYAPPQGEQSDVIQSYYYHENDHEKTSTVKKEEQKERVTLDKKTVQNKQIIRKKRVNAEAAVNPSTHSSTTSNKNGEKIDTLLALLHDAIQKQQHYPASALEMERQGRVTVSFTLFTNGMIRDLRIIKSSGTASLDAAALAAVNQAAPFQINNYLSASRAFTLDVVFELSE